MRVGYGFRDITPKPGITLCGFASRRNEPSVGVDDPLSVHSIAVEHGGQTVLLLVFDLLALGSQITSELKAIVEELGELGATPDRTIFCCTHTHSAPAAIELIGCGVSQRRYWDTLLAAARDAGLTRIRIGNEHLLS